MSAEHAPVSHVDVIKASLEASGVQNVQTITNDSFYDGRKGLLYTPISVIGERGKTNPESLLEGVARINRRDEKITSFERTGDRSFNTINIVLLPNVEYTLQEGK